MLGAATASVLVAPLMVALLTPAAQAGKTAPFACVSITTDAREGPEPAVLITAADVAQALAARLGGSPTIAPSCEDEGARFRLEVSVSPAAVVWSVLGEGAPTRHELACAGCEPLQIVQLLALQIAEILRPTMLGMSEDGAGDIDDIPTPTAQLVELVEIAESAGVQEASASAPPIVEQNEAVSTAPAGPDAALVVGADGVVNTWTRALSARAKAGMLFETSFATGAISLAAEIVPAQQTNDVTLRAWSFEAGGGFDWRWSSISAGARLLLRATRVDVRASGPLRVASPVWSANVGLSGNIGWTMVRLGEWDIGAAAELRLWGGARRFWYNDERVAVESPVQLAIGAFASWPF